MVRLWADGTYVRAGLERDEAALVVAPTTSVPAAMTCSLTLSQELPDTQELG